MLTQAEANILIALEKIFLNSSQFLFPSIGKSTRHPIRSSDGREKFLLAIVRSNKRPLKCSYTELCKGSIILLRIDTEQELHINPDGMEVPAPHLHIFQVGFDDRFAYPLPEIFTNSRDLVKTFYDLLSYSNVINIDEISILAQGGLFDATRESSNKLDQ